MAKGRKSELAARFRRLARPQPVWRPRPEVLLSPRIPEPMHGMAPRVVLGEKWWNETRRAAYSSTAFHCIACGVWKYQARSRQWLEGHELYEIDYLLGRMVYLETVPLCTFCHNYIHRGRLQALLAGGEIHHAKFAEIIHQGDRVLREAGLKLPEEYMGPMAEWADWRLVVDGTEYLPKYKSFEYWRKAFEEGKSCD